MDVVGRAAGWRFRLRRRRGSLAAVVASILLLAAPGARACQVCVPYPTRTAADVIVTSDAVMLAREDADRPFHLAVTEALKGDPPIAPLDLFLPSHTRRQLAASADAAILLARETPEAGWRRVAYADADYQTFVRQVLARAPSWLAAGGAEERLDFFEGLLGASNRAIQEVALLEIARAPYGRIRRAAAALPVAQVRAALSTLTLAEWWPVYILMLAQSDDPADRRRIRRGYDGARAVGTSPTLAAWTTALIEIDGAEAVRQVEADFLAAPDADTDGVAQALSALSVHGSEGDLALRPFIVAAYRRVLDAHPEQAGTVAKDLATWEDWSLARRFADLLAAKTVREPASLYVMAYYVGMARERGALQ